MIIPSPPPGFNTTDIIIIVLTCVVSLCYVVGTILLCSSKLEFDKDWKIVLLTLAGYVMLVAPFLWSYLYLI